MSKPHLLVVSAGAAREYREYILKSLAQRFEISLLDHRGQSWTRPYVSNLLLSDVLDENAVAEVRGMHKRKPIEGVLCYDELRIVHAARLARTLQLPTTDPAALSACRDKYKTRVVLEHAGILQPKFHLATSLQEALSSAEDIGYPLIIKPRALMASEGVAIVRSQTDLRNRYRGTADLVPDKGEDYRFSSILLEEYLDGPEFSIDGAVADGSYIPLFLARKTTGFSPYFEEVGHEVRANDELLKDPSFLALLRSVHEALSQSNGMTHTEVKMTKKGPAVIEVNARLGGDLIPRVGWYATGIDAALVAGDIAVGARPLIKQTHSANARIQFYYPERALAVSRIELPRLGIVAEAQALVEPGDSVDVPPKQFVVGRLAYAIATGASDSDLQEQLSEFGRGIAVEGRPRS